MSGALLLVVEGRGEVKACGTLVARLLHELQLDQGAPFRTVPVPRRLPLLRTEDVTRACEIARRERPAALLLTSDLEDHCPRDRGPALAAHVRSLGLPFPAAVVLFYREYETLFVAAAASLAGSELVQASGTTRLARSVTPPADPETPRDAKGWVSTNLLGRTRYKPTVHQLPFTRAVSLSALRESGLSSFRRLESAVRFLAAEVAEGTTGVYPG